MDYRDRHLNKHMKLRMQLAASLPATRQCDWARKCVIIAQKQHRSAFYMMSQIWLANVRTSARLSA